MMRPTSVEPVSLEEVPGVGFRARLRYGKGLRQRFLIKCTDRAIAQSRANRMRDVAELLTAAGHSADAPLVLKTAGEAASEKGFVEVLVVAEKLRVSDKRRKRVAQPVTTFRQLGEHWTSGKLHREFPDHVKGKDGAQDASRLAKLCAIDVGGIALGDVPLAHFTIDHAERAMAQLPGSAKRPGSRRQYVQVLHRVLVLAVYPCRLIPANPLPKGFVPKSGKPPAYPYLYPAEDEALMGGAGKVPLSRRVLFGFLAREGCRIGEAAALTFADLDLERGAVTLDENKTDDARAWALDPGVVVALRAWRAQRGAESTDRVFVDEHGRPLPSESLADVLRADLQAVGVDRKELLTAGTNRQPLRVHDLRGTFITLSLANGKTETWVADRTGHTSSNMINRYRRAARSAGELELGPLLPLEQVVPELCQRRPTRAQWQPEAVEEVGQRKRPDPGPEGGPTRSATLSHASADLKNAEENMDRASAASAHAPWFAPSNPRVVGSNPTGCANQSKRLAQRGDERRIAAGTPAGTSIG